ncbi:MAG: sigma-70 family RNA polymerase sigma factor [Bacteroidetes bacterium]|nr:sigma-70 family RNA polymerase sigma factor [Bacteroidota bacterium]
MSFLTNISSDDREDHELVSAFRTSSDLKVLAILYQRYLDILYGVCLKYLDDAESAKDAVMDIFEELAQKLPRHEVAYFRGWVYTLAKNHCLMKLRSSKRIPTASFDTEHMQTAEDLHLTEKMEKEDQLGRLSKCIETLTDDQRTVVELFYLKNLCYKEIENLTGLQWNRVRSHIQNGRRNLKICIEQQQKATA